MRGRKSGALPVTWQPVANAGEGSALVPPADANRFYRLRQP
jgi:hypothetical protein